MATARTSRSRLAPRHRELALVGVVTLVELLGVRTGPAGPTPSAALGALGIVLALLQGLPLLRRRQHPWPVLVTVTVAFTLHALLLDPVPPYGAWVALAGVAVHRGARTTGLATGGVLAAVLIGFLASPDVDVDPTPALLVTVAVAAGGQLVRERRARAAATADRTAAEERLRIAREMHDVLGHSLGAIAVQSSTGRMALDAGQPDVARASLAAIESASRDSMAEVRAVLGRLRDDGSPDLGSLDDLVRTASGGGITVSVRRDGDLADLPAPVSRAAYRVVQEALTNAARHAVPCQVQVAVRRAGGRLEVEVTDDGSAPAAADRPAGHGLVGMRERVAAVGGRLSAGPVPDGGWRVRAELPLEDGWTA